MKNLIAVRPLWMVLARTGIAACYAPAPARLTYDVCLTSVCRLHRAYVENREA